MAGLIDALENLDFALEKYMRYTGRISAGHGTLILLHLNVQPINLRHPVYSAMNEVLGIVKRLPDEPRALWRLLLRYSRDGKMALGIRRFVYVNGFNENCRWSDEYLLQNYVCRWLRR